MGLPLLAIGAAAAPAIGGIASTILNNRAQRKLSMDMYNLQRQDALADWNRQVEYQSPAAQMARYKEAGLNPNLIYGQQQSSPQVRATQMDVPNLKPLPLDTVGSILPRYLSIQQQQANLDKTDAVMRTIEARNTLMGLESVGKMIKNSASAFDLSQKQRLADTVFETALNSLESLQHRNTLLSQDIEYGEKQWAVVLPL